MTHVKTVPQNNGKAQQFLAALIVNLLSISSGIGCGWPSPVIPQLRSSKPPVGDSPMTDDQISWINSLLPIGHTMSWSLIIFGQNHICLYAARLSIGMSASMTIFIVPIYVSEIASEDIRGSLGSLMIFSSNGGVLIAYTAGAFLSYHLFACVSLLFSVVFILIFIQIPETPAYLVRRNRQLQANKSLMFFRGNNQVLVDQELSRLKSQVNFSNRASNKLGFSGFIYDRATRMGLIISFILLGGQQLSGNLVMISYAETIFQRAASSIIIGVIQMFGSYASTMMIDRAGRRPLILTSCLGMAISHLVIGLFFNMQRNEYDLTSISWLPLVAFSTYISFYCLGIGPVPSVFASEVFRLDISSSASTLCYTFYWCMSSIPVKAFGPGMDLVGIDVCFFVLASFCVICLVCSYYLMPETKGRKR